jgi:hypothetical protein
MFIPKFEIEYRYVIWGLFIVMLAGCVSCSMSSTKDANLVDDISDNCSHGLKRAEVTQDDDDKSVIVECAGYSL